MNYASVSAAGVASAGVSSVGAASASTATEVPKTLAESGLATGSWILMAVGLIFVGITLFVMLRGHSEDRP